MINSQIKILSKKYLKISLKTLFKVYHECENKAYTTSKTLENFLNREPNHVGNILKGLELDDLVIRKREGFVSKIWITNLGKEVVKRILKDLEG